VPQDGFESPDSYVNLATKLFPRSDPDLFRELAQFVGAYQWSTMGMAQSRGYLTCWRWRVARPTAEGESQLRKAMQCPVLLVRAEHSELLVGTLILKAASEYAQGRAEMLAGAAPRWYLRTCPGRWSSSSNSWVRDDWFAVAASSGTPRRSNRSVRTVADGSDTEALAMTPSRPKVEGETVWRGDSRYEEARGA
jgi:hypothetical protein